MWRLVRLVVLVLMPTTDKIPLAVHDPAILAIQKSDLQAFFWTILTGARP